MKLNLVLKNQPLTPSNPQTTSFDAIKKHKTAKMIFLIILNRYFDIFRLIIQRMHDKLV
jgi:hypothetical protein